MTGREMIPAREPAHLGDVTDHGAGDDGADAEHAEAALYADLVADRLGRSVRLEQERIAFGIIERAMLDCGGA